MVFECAALNRFDALFREGMLDGSVGGSAQISNELWQLDLATGLWTQQPTGPRARLSHVCVMTQQRDVLCYGGLVHFPNGEVRGALSSSCSAHQVKRA